MTRDMTLSMKMPGRRFVPFNDGFLFLQHSLSEGTKIVAELDEDYDLGVVAFHNVTIGATGGVGCGYWMLPSANVKYAPNYLTVYRNTLRRISFKELMTGDGTNLVLKYRPPMLRIFTMSDDLVVIGSDLPDRMKQRLDSQE